MKIKRKFSSVFFSFLCIFLGLWMAFASTLSIIANSQESSIYISDIRLWTGGSSKSEAKAYFNSIGYTMLDADLNAGTDTDRRVYLGYKTTEDPDEAITDIRMLPMDTGYQLYNYKEITEYLASQNQGTAKKMASAAATFADYYDEGSPRAITAYKALNLFNIGDRDRTGLGDYILENRDDLQYFFVKMIINSSAAVVGSVTSLLSIGVSPYENDYDPQTKTFFTSNWAQRVPESAIWELLEEGMTADEERALDRAYNDNAKILFKELQDFAMLYENARVRYNEQAIKDKKVFDSYESAVKNMNDVTEEDADLIYIAAYETLSGYALTSRMNLADWLISIGHQTDATVDYRQLYPVVEALGTAEMDMISLTSFVAAVNNLGNGDEAEDYEDVLKNSRKAIKKYNGNSSESLSVWETPEESEQHTEVDAGFIERLLQPASYYAHLDANEKYYAYTSEAVRKSSAENEISKKTYLEKLDEDFTKAMGWIKLAVGIATTLVSLADVILKICACCSWVSVAGSACAMKILGWLSLAGLIISGLVMLAEFGYSVFCFFYELINGIDKTLGHTEKPAYVFDSVESARGSTTVRYTSVLDNTGQIGDVNAAKQYKWCILAFTKDKNVGSPLCLDDKGEVFRVIYGNSSNQNGYDNMKYFGERNVGSTNAYCEEDELNGCYLHFRTVSSLKGAAPESDTEQETIVDTEATSYIESIILGVAKNVSEAKAKIVRHVGKYYTYDYNLSPEMEFATYIGYSITSDPSKAITDIRIAPYAGSSDGAAAMIIGDVTYDRADIIGAYVSNSDEQTKPQADALYYTTDQNAGSPISVDGLHFVTDFANVEPGWEPVSFFCADLPYDFNTAFTTVQGELLDTYSGYNPLKNDKTKCVYMYFEPTEKYVGGEKYLSGFYFIGGYSLVATPDYSDEKLLDFSTLKNKIAAMPNTVICSTQLNYAIRKGSFTSPGTGEIEEYLVYTYTYNPKRAISDAALYQGTTYVDSLPYCLTKPTGTGSTVGYIACSYIGQQLYKVNVWNDKVSQYAAAFIHKGNTYMDSKAMNILPERAASVRDYGIIDAQSDVFDFGFRYSDYIAQGLFVTRHVKDKEPLKLSDVVFSDNSYTAVEENGRIFCTVENGEKALDGSKAQGYFHSVYELKDPYGTKASDLAYPEWCRTIKNDPDQRLITFGNKYKLFIYLRGAKESKPTYISGLSVGSFSRALYGKETPGVKEEELKAADTIVDYSALITALSSCSGEVIPVNLCLSNQNDAWYNRQQNGKADHTAAENKPAAYIGVSRTTDPKKAITGVLLYQVDGFVTAAEISVGGVTYKCESTQSPIEMDGKNYYLYYTYNAGALPGKPIEEITVDNMPLIQGYSTNLSFDSSHTAAFGNIDQTTFIHLKVSKTTYDYYNKLYIGKGINKRAALCDLLTQGCTDFIDMDLNEGVTGSSIYLGYRTKEIDWTKVNGQQTESAIAAALNDQTKEAVYDIVLTRNEEYHPDGFISKDGIYYYPVSAYDLNDGKGTPLYMYYACPYYSSRYNSSHEEDTLLPQEVFTGYYKKLGFARYDRVPYNSSLAGVSASENTVTPWEYILFSDSARAADFNSGAISFNTGSHYADDIRITMFGQRSDGSVKPAGAITGGFLKNTVDLGVAVYNYDR